MNQPFISNRFPYLPVIVRIEGFEIRADALIDTGFDGHVILPVSMLPNLPAASRSLLRWRLGDGRDVLAPSFEGTLQLTGLDQSYDAVIVSLADEVIIGRAFIDNFRITLDHGRRVLVEP